jgi:hypothetical protein
MLSGMVNLDGFWKVKSIGIVDKNIQTNDTIALERKCALTFENNRYFVSWSWKEDEPKLPT